MIARISLVVFLVATAGTVVVCRHYRDDLAAARQRIAGNSQVIETACGPVEYAIAGEGMPVLVVHGAGGGFDQGLLIATDLVEQGYQAIAVSRFGYLRTPLPENASAKAQADAHACLLDTLGLGRVAVLGASAGAPSSLQLAIRHSDRVSALVLLVPATYLPVSGSAGTDVPRGLGLVFDTALKWDLPLWAASRIARRSLIRTMLGTPPALLNHASDADRERVFRMLDYVLPVTERRAGLLNDGVVTTTLERFDLELVGAPTLVISAEDDLYGTFERARYTAEEISNARFVGYADGGHLLVGRQEQVTSEVDVFFQTNR